MMEDAEATNVAGNNFKAFAHDHSVSKESWSVCLQSEMNMGFEVYSEKLHMPQDVFNQVWKLLRRGRDSIGW